MQAFFYLFTRYLAERAKSQDLYVIHLVISLCTINRLSRDWDRIKSPAEDQIVPYATLPKPQDTKNLNKLAVLKVNGGLGTSMGSCTSFLSERVADPQDRNDRCQERTRSQR
jgi:UTP--glucose-1-phosphate uridylyltransferase